MHAFMIERSRSRTLLFLQGLFPGRATLSPVEAAKAALDWTEQTARNALSQGRYPIPIIEPIPGKKLVRLDDLADWMDAGQPKRGPGRPKGTTKVAKFLQQQQAGEGR